MDQREKDYIQSFAESWNFKIDWSKIHPSGCAARKRLVANDDKVTEEEVILTEVLAILSGYDGNEGGGENHSVVIAPCNREQTLILKTLLPGSNEVEIAGGWGHLVGSYCSPKYANRMCERYREQAFFTVSLVTGLDIAA